MGIFSATASHRNPQALPLTRASYPDRGRAGARESSLLTTAGPYPPK